VSRRLDGGSEAEVPALPAPEQQPSAAVTLYVARDCHLCERARDELGTLAGELGFAVDEIDITGVPELESRYRKWIPVIEVEGERVSVYRVDPDELRARHKLGRI
jgi:glutaredoxin